MPKFMKKPVVIEAFQYNGDLMDSNGEYYVPEWASAANTAGVLFYEGPELYIKTMEGALHASVGDYIIKGVEGELYPCKPDIFGKTYQSIDDEKEE